MAGSLFERAKRDAKRFVTSGGFEENITMTTPSGLITLPLTGYATKHYFSYDSDGLPINAKNAHISVDENILQLNAYPYRNNAGEVNLKDHIVTYPESSGVIKSYVVKDQRPDQTLGLIVLILGDHIA